KTVDEYYDYLTNLSSNETPFYIVTPKHLGGNRLTVPKLNQLIEQYKPGIVGIDQISLMDDDRRQSGDPKRIQYSNISEDLFLTAEKDGIAVVAPAQASRDETEDDEEKTEGVEDISESEAVGQNANGVLVIKKIDVTMKLTIRKNRYGEVN